MPHSLPQWIFVPALLILALLLAPDGIARLRADEGVASPTPITAAGSRMVPGPNTPVLTEAPTLELVSQLPGWAYAVAMRDNYVYAVINEGQSYSKPTVFAVIDISNPVSPTVVGRAATPILEPFPPANLWPADIALMGNTAYVADGVNGMHLLDLTNPISPTQIGFYPLTNATTVAVTGTSAYVASESGDAGSTSVGLHIVDVSNPLTPTLVGFYAGNEEHRIGNLVGYSELHAVGRYAHAVHKFGPYELQLLDLLDPAHPRLVYYVDGVQSLALNDGLAYAQTRYGISVLDVSSPITPSAIVTSSINSGFALWPGSMVSPGNYLYAILNVLETHGLQVGASLKIFRGSPACFQEVASYQFPQFSPGWPNGVATNGPYIAVARRDYGLSLFRFAGYPQPPSGSQPGTVGPYRIFLPSVRTALCPS